MENRTNNVKAGKYVGGGALNQSRLSENWGQK